MHTHTHIVQYYETDRMNFVHHSNYIRWFEEGRVAYLEAAGAPYTDMEAAGLLCPVLEAHCRYRHPCTFGDTVEITTALSTFGRVRFTFSYTVHRQGDGLLLAEGHTEHCFIDANGRPLALARRDATLAARLTALSAADAAGTMP